ncbi:WD40-repeat protein (notchless protein) [Ceratobasidium theobromae]|uniref:WD40-repeat protein (Notchless protein) n=1 Tax=Ceratobasidium theobromae TaxID=1582974 RepID=A0A5N5QFP2_9AGAM|nr:WD40-repeat protein (notchless protein) [Ceratobasidium theobromae]
MRNLCRRAHKHRAWRLSIGNNAPKDLHSHLTALNSSRDRTTTPYDLRSVAFSPCGQYAVSGSDDHTIRAWNVQNSTLINDPFTGHTDIVRSVAFSPNGECIASSSYDRTVRVWHTHSGALVAGPFFGHVNVAMSIAFFPGGTRIVSGSWDSTIRIWDLSNIPGIPSTSKYPPALPSLDLAHSAMPPMDWAVKDDGWITNYDGNVLFWASAEVIQRLLTPHCSSIISRFGTIDVDMSTALFGECWKDTRKPKAISLPNLSRQTLKVGQNAGPDVNAAGGMVVNEGMAGKVESWKDSLVREYSTRGSIPGVLQQLSAQKLNITNSDPSSTDNMFEKFSVRDIGQAGSGSDHTVQAGLS